MATKNEVGVYVGRFNPPHNGHITVINELIRDFNKDNIVLIGSCIESNTLHNIFSYQQRREMLREVFGGYINIAGIPDFHNNNLAWFSYIKDLVKLKYNGLDRDIVFYGGSQNDIFYAVDAGFKTKVISRYDNSKLSSSEIKDNLIQEKSIFEMVPQEIEGTIIAGFNEFWHNRYKKTK